MSHFARPARLVMGLIALTSLVIVGAPSVDAVTTPSMADDGSGGVVVTYGASTATNYTEIQAFASPHTCASQRVLSPEYKIDSNPNFPEADRLAASPATVRAGTNMLSFVSGAPAYAPLPEGSFTFCLYTLDLSNGIQVTFVQQLAANVTAEPTTTTTAAPSTTTTAAVEEPVVPAYTG